MTQQGQREMIALVFPVLSVARAVFPKPIIERATKEPYENQLLARLCYAAMAVFGLLVCYGIRSEGMHIH
jgi:hypothetical protein